MTAPARIAKAYLRERIEAGDRPADIARALGVDQSTVRRHLKLHDIPYSSKTGPKRSLPSTAFLIERIQQGTPPTKLARAFGVGRAAVHLALLRDGYRLSGGQVHPIPQSGDVQ